MAQRQERCLRAWEDDWLSIKTLIPGNLQLTSVRVKSLSLAKILFHHMTKLHQWNLTFSVKELFIPSRDSLLDLICTWLLVKLLWLVAFEQVNGWYHSPAYWPASLLESADFHWIPQLPHFFPASPFAWVPQSATHLQSSPPCLLQLKLFTMGPLPWSWWLKATDLTWNLGYKNLYLFLVFKPGQKSFLPPSLFYKPLQLW